MSNFLESMLTELKTINLNNLMEPTGEIEPDDHAIGEIDDDLKRMYSLAKQWEKKAFESLLAARYASDNSMRASYMYRANELKDKNDLLMKMLWISIRDSFNLWGKPRIDIKKNWIAVWSNPPPSIPQILGFFGGNPFE